MKEKLMKLCHEIEKIPASEQQTKVSIMAYEILQSVKNRKILKKDIVISKGTVFESLSGRSTSYGHGMVGAVVGLTKDSHGEFVYGIDEADKELSEWFE